MGDSVREWMTAVPCTVTKATPAAELAGLFASRRVTRASTSALAGRNSSASGGWSVSATSRIPDTALHSVPGGFVGRGVATDGDGYGYLYSDNGVDWIYQSDRAAAGSRTAGQIPSFVIETEDTPLLRLPGDGRAFAPPAWPVSGLWLEGDVIWVQTPDAAWSSYDGESWTEFPIDASTGVGNGYSVLLPVGDVARLATSLDDRITLLRWDPGSTRE